MKRLSQEIESTPMPISELSAEELELVSGGVVDIAPLVGIAAAPLLIGAGGKAMSSVGLKR